MKTESMIDVLMAEAGPVPRHVTERRFASAGVFGIALATAMMLVAFGLRPDIESAALLPMFWFKLMFPAAIAVAAMWMAARLSRPGARMGFASIAVAAPFVILWLMAAVTLLNTEPAARVDSILGNTWPTCVPEIALLALPAFAATFWAMRGLAPTRLALAGAAGGLMAGGIGAMIYALRCPEMEAPFLAVWYVAGIAANGVAGALLGPRLLRW
ncbi:MAG: DUF1109 domain-containing protein [Pseudomonadota bacterium]|nr:DUF1109 domain-containing protein [Burkholderiaceae bacterium]MDQ3447513.1 DUF1109 domain-containing protein [Pseudomonadota bacterium]